MFIKVLQALSLIYLVVIVVFCWRSDVRKLRIPNTCSLAILVGGLMRSALAPFPDPYASLLGIAAGGSAMLALKLAYHRWRGRDGLGLGDVKLVAAAGAWVGWQGMAPVLLISSLSALVHVSVRLAGSTRFDAHGRIPFAPFIGVGLLAVWTCQTVGWGPWILVHR
jgi:prepilin signal peptidase PulO-like enzyme (type II secretory pathway)